MRKGEIACHKQFLLFSQSFLPNMALFICSFFDAGNNVVCNFFISNQSEKLLFG